MSTALKPSDDAWLFGGKRKTSRKTLALPVECRGAGGTVARGKTVDVSCGGMLVQLTDGSLRAPADPGALIGFAMRLETAFRTGMEASIAKGKVCAHAKLVRLVSSPRGTAPILLACRFDPPLSPIDGHRLGLVFGGDPADPTAKHEVPAPTARRG